MLKAQDQIRRLAAFTSVVLMATAEALAQENQARPSRRILVGTPDRKWAVLEFLAPGPAVTPLPPVLEP
jgi:hypothetical protein